MWEPIKPAPPVTSAFKLPPSLSKDCSNRTQYDRNIHRKGTMLDVIKIVFQFYNRLCNTGYIAIVDLRPACQPRLDQQARPVKRDLLLIFADQSRSFGARSY